MKSFTYATNSEGRGVQPIGFLSLKQNRRESMEILIDDNENKLTDDQSMIRLLHSCYSKLFSAEPKTPASNQAMADMLKHTINLIDDKT